MLSFREIVAADESLGPSPRSLLGLLMALVRRNLAWRVAHTGSNSSLGGPGPRRGRQYAGVLLELVGAEQRLTVPTQLIRTAARIPSVATV